MIGKSMGITGDGRVLKCLCNATGTGGLLSQGCSKIRYLSKKFSLEMQDSTLYLKRSMGIIVFFAIFAILRRCGAQGE